MRSGKGVCLPRDDHSGRLFQLKPPDFGLPIPKSTRFRAKGLTALVRQSQNMLFTQLLQFCWHRFRCQTVQPHCHLIHGPRFNLVARVRRGPAAAGRHSRTDPVRLACLGAGRAPRGRLRICFQNVPRVCQRGAFCYVRPPALRWPSSQGRWIVSTLHKTRHFHVKPRPRFRSLFKASVRSQNSSGPLAGGAKIFVSGWGTCPLTPTNWSTTVRMGASCAPCT